MCASNGRDEYSRVSHSRVPTLVACPLCGAPAEMWRHQPADSAPRLTAMCSNPADFEDGIDGGCLLFVPTRFYAATIREAARYWNDYAQWISAQREARR